MKKINYVELYAKSMKEDNKIFEQHQRLINSQIRSSILLFKETFKDKDFKEEARKYLKNVGLI